eukprot:scaffold191723_cov13-Tisochrysis_lutea.AAC.1
MHAYLAGQVVAVTGPVVAVGTAAGVCMVLQLPAIAATANAATPNFSPAATASSIQAGATR